MARTAGADDRLGNLLASALLWAGSFCWAVALFFPLDKLLKVLPPTPAVAIGRVTIEGVSKPREYVYAALYYLLVPLLTVLLRRGLARLHARVGGTARDALEHLASVVLFVIPLVAAPFLYLATRKELWGMLLPPVLAVAGPAALRLFRTRQWLRSLFEPPLGAFHALVLTEAAAWVVFRWIATGKRIAHFPTLLLEVPFALFFVALYWGIAIAAARAASLARGSSLQASFRAIALGGMPLLLLPLAPFTPLPLRATATAVIATAIAGFVLGAAGRWRSAGRGSPGVRGVLAWAAIPLLLFTIGWASNANLTAWIDLFHRGETLGPASEYLAGEVPYVDTFVLHGMLENGLLDATLMKWLGRDASIARARAVAMSALSLVALWALGMVLFGSMPLALAVVALGTMTFVENPRALLEIVVVALLFAALRRGGGAGLALAGAAAAVALFFSLDVGLYSLVASFVTIAVWSFWNREGRPVGRIAVRNLAAWVLGVVLGAAPFVGWLAAQGALDAFARTSFVTVPRVIDAAWSLPFPELGRVFRYDFDLRALAEFVLGAGARFVLNPAVLAIGAVVVLARLRVRSPGRLDLAVLTLAVFGIVTQRSALGRADFQHQYFSAFLVAPLLVVLLAMAAGAARAVWREGEPRARIAVAFVGAAFVPLLATVLWVPDLLATRLEAVIGWRARSAGLHADPLGARLQDRVAAVSTEIRRTTGPDDPIFDFSNQPAFYFFADRRNPTRFFQIPIASARETQLEIITALERTRTPLVLRRSPEGYDRFDGIPNDVRAQAVAAYLDERYEHHRTIRGVELWTRRATAPQRPPATYLSAIRVPDAIPPETERLVFPAIGSTAGAAGAFWSSDLVIRNPHDTEVSLRFRWAVRDGTRDRTLVLGPRQLLVVQDVARSWFGAGQSVGPLWIEVPADRKPVLLAETRDVRRTAPPSLAPALSLRDAAAADDPSPRLTIAGVRGGETRRVNLGVVNFGIVPARVRVEVLGADGAPIGRAVETAIAEEQSWLVVDAGDVLGADLSGPSIVEVTVLDGVAAAWASVIDGATGIHEMIPAFPSKR